MMERKAEWYREFKGNEVDDITIMQHEDHWELCINFEGVNVNGDSRYAIFSFLPTDRLGGSFEKEEGWHKKLIETDGPVRVENIPSRTKK